MIPDVTISVAAVVQTVGAGLVLWAVKLLASLTAEFHAHEKLDDMRFEYLEDKIKDLDAA